MDENVIDAEFTEMNIKGDKNIRYSATQVASILDISVSKLRYYATQFEDILDLEFSNGMRKYTEPSIKKMQFIIKLKNEGLTVQQIKDYCQREDLFDEKGLIPQDNPLAVEIFTEAIKMQMQEQLEDFRSKLQVDIKNEMKIMLQAQYQMNEEMKQEVCTTLDDMISEKLEMHLEKSSEQISEQNVELQNQVAEMKSTLEEIKQTAYVTSEEIKKAKAYDIEGIGWWKRFFFGGIKRGE